MKYRSTRHFERDFGRLPREHRRQFLAMLRDHFLPAVVAGAFSGAPPWPTRLRLHRLAGREIYSITWSFASPDGRATFHIEKDPAGDPVLVWRRIGDHSIYRDP